MIEVNRLIPAKVDENFLKKVAKIVLKGENTGEEGLSIAVVCGSRMKNINKKYKGKDKATDVLSFKGDQKLKEGLGEIVICFSEVKKNAKKFNVPEKEELARVLIHGILHLLGEDHEKNKKEADKMEKKEKYYLAKVKAQT